MFFKDKNGFYKACFNSMQVGILVFNSTKDILLCNTPVMRILGYSKAELELKKVTNLFKNTSIFSDFIANPSSRKFNSSIELYGIQKNGLEIPIELVFGKIEFNTKQYYKILISDISVRKNKEANILNLTHKLEEEIELRNIALENTIDKLKASFNTKKELHKLIAIKNQLKNKSFIKLKKNSNTLNNSFLHKYIDEILLKKSIYKYKKGETIYCEGNLSNHIFLIKKGIVKTYKIDEQGKEFITEFYTNRQYFGYSSFVKRKSHFENSKAVTNVKLYKINNDDISIIINKNYKILYKFIDVLASNLIDAKEELLLLAYGSVRKKTARTLLKISNKHPLKFKGEIEISRINLANSIGIAPETLIRTLHDFKKEKLITDKNKKIKIINKNKLLEIQ
ncbi:cyclic nucleotide-binding domain-containing protein [Lutibacter sp.]